ncbi:MAG: hypothetical protein LBU84_17485 [Prevotella sp.]|jgi:hypothetical protein|nr:hypothetical protein [Prevotella sp.]
MSKYLDKDTAISKAKEISKDSEERYFVVLSAGYYYVDTNGFIRNWETLICEVEKGERLK